MTLLELARGNYGSDARVEQRGRHVWLYAYDHWSDIGAPAEARMYLEAERRHIAASEAGVAASRSVAAQGMGGLL